MKTMTCKQLGGACDLEFSAETFEEMVELSKQHGMEMFQKNDTEHLAAMEKARALMNDPKAMAEFIAERENLFNSLPDD